MERVAKMTLVWAWMAMLVILPAVPHHHHGSRMCMVMEQCAHDGAYNDEHTSHHTCPERGGRLVCSGHFLMTEVRHSDAQSVDASEHLPLFALAGDGRMQGLLSVKYYPLVPAIRLTASPITGIRQLRAPPFLVV